MHEPDGIYNVCVRCGLNLGGGRADTPCNPGKPAEPKKEPEHEPLKLDHDEEP